MTGKKSSKIPEATQTYLGDGLYAKYDGYHLVLMANVPTTDTAYLEPVVWEALKAFMDEILKESEQ